MTIPVQISRYEVKRELGRGGMATVYLAYDPRFKRDVAVKVLPRQFTHDPMFRARFEREAQTIASLEHPAIVPVYDFGEEDEQPYLVMRYMLGGSLADRLEQGALAPQAITAIMRRLGSALDEAHKHHVIHRDLKPGNILFDHLQNAYLSDFGIVKLSEATSNFTGSAIIGTPAYMSPEQARGEGNIDGRSDIYALGTILFEMLTGQQPYRADTPMGIIIKHLTEPVPHILAVKRDLPPAYETLIGHAMAKNRGERYATAGEMATAVNTIITGAPLPLYKPPPELEETFVLPPLLTTIPAPRSKSAPPPKKSSLWRWLGGGVIILLLALLGIGGYSSGWFIAAAPTATSSLPAPIEATSVAAAPETATPTLTLAVDETETKPQPVTSDPETATPTLTAVSPTGTPSATALPSNTPTTAAASAAAASATLTIAPTATDNAAASDALASDTPTPDPTAATTATATPTAVAPASAPGRNLPVNFDNFGCWSVGSQKNGTFCASSEQAQSGASGKLDYHFITDENDFVAFYVCDSNYSECIGIPNDPTALQLSVYGDGSGHLLNAWIIDSQNEIWAVPFGSISFGGWQQLTGCIDAGLGWPGGHIAGPSNETIDYPIAFYALVFDDQTNAGVSEGAIYLDDLQPGSC